MPSSSARPESTSSRFKVSVPPYFSVLASSHEAPGCVQQFGQHLPPPVRLLYQRNESAQLEIGDGFIETQALVGIVFGPCLVSGLELADQRVEVIQRAKMPQPEELKMSGKMGHVEQPVILAKLIEIQAGKPVAVDHQMLGSEVPVDWGSSNASKGMVAVLVNRVLGCIVARYIRSGP
jgi:hypothetical protein